MQPGNLSQREIEVIHLIAEGLTDKEIAARLRITPRTVSEHIVNIRAKLGASNRASAVYVYFQQSLWQRDPVAAVRSETMQTTTNTSSIRTAQPGDAAKIAELRFSIESIAQGAEHLSPLTHAQAVDDAMRELADGSFRIYVAQDANGTVIGYNSLVRHGWNPPDTRDLRLIVEPSARGQGVGQALWHDALAYCRQQNVTELTSAVGDDRPTDIKFALDRQFVEVFNRVNFKLDLTRFDTRRFSGVRERTSALGIRITNMGELGNTEEAQRRLYQVNSWCAALDLPGVKDEPAWDSWEQFRQAVCASWWYQPDGQFVAIDTQTGELVGMCAVTANARSGGADVLHSGVDRRYRRNPVIGQALKLAAIEYCQQHGCTILGDNHDMRDAPNVALDFAMGFERLPGWILLKRRVGDVKRET